MSSNNSDISRYAGVLSKPEQLFVQLKSKVVLKLEEKA